MSRISNYTRPLHQISLKLEESSTGTAPRLGACAIGNQFLLSRYGNETVPLITYGAQGGNQVLPWKHSVAGVDTALALADYAVNLPSARLHGVGLEATLGTVEAADADTQQRCYIGDLTAPHIVRSGPLPGTNKYFKGTTLATYLRGRPVKVGDICIVTSNSGATVKKRNVIGLLGELGSASNGSIGNSATNPPTATLDVVDEVVPDGTSWAVAVTSDNFKGLLNGATYEGYFGDGFTIEVTSEGADGSPGEAEVAVTSLSGLFAPQTGVVTSDGGGGEFVINVQSVIGLTFQLTGESVMTEGEVFTFGVRAGYTRASSTQLPLSGTYSGTADTTLILKVTTGSAEGSDSATGAKIEVSDTVGILTPAEYTLTEDGATVIGLGLTLTPNMSGTALPQAGLRKGDIYTVVCTAAAESTTVFDRVVLDGPAVNLEEHTDTGTAVKVEFRLPFTGEILSTDASGGTAWTTNATTGLTVTSGLGTYVSDRSAGYQWPAFVDTVGTLAVSWKAVKLATDAATYVVISSVDDITDNLGTIDVENDLAYGAWRMLAGSAGRPVAALNVGGTTSALLTAALRKLESTDAYAYPALVSDGDDILEWKELLRDHCTTMSGPTVRNFRQGWVGTDFPGVHRVLGPKSSGQPYKATIRDNGSGAYVIVEHTETGLDFTDLVSAGDTFKSLVSEASYVIASVDSATQLTLVTGPLSAVVVAEGFELWAADTIANAKTWLEEHANALSSEFLVSVAHVTGYKDTTVIPARFTAAELAGVRSALPSQMGLTSQTVTTVTSLPSSHTRWTPTDLDYVSSSGHLVVTQDTPGGSCYVRDQLTTEIAKGDLYSQANAMSVMFELGFLAKDTFSNLIGRRNVTPRFLRIMESRFAQLLETATKVDERSTSEDPLIASFDTLSVTQHPVLRNRIDMKSRVGIALPLGVLYTELTGFIQTA